MVELKVRTSYDFEFVAPEYIGGGFVNATVMIGAMDYESAMRVQDVANIHRRILPKLGTGISKDPRDLTYVQVKTSNGDIRVFAIEWLAKPPVFSTAATRFIEIKGEPISRYPEILEILRQNGIMNARLV